MIILNIFWVLPMAVLSNFYMNYNVVITFIAYVPMVVYLIKIGAGLEYNKKIWKNKTNIILFSKVSLDVIH